MAIKEILIYGNIGYDFWTGDGITAKSIQSQLQTLNDDKDVSEITVRINSPGGSVFEGVAIYNMLQQSAKPVNTIIDGIAYSMGAIIAMAGKKRQMAKNATLLLHCCSGVAVGNVRDMKNTIQMMEALDTGLSESIAETTGLSVKDVKDKWMNYDDHTFTAAQALENKLINEVLDFSAEIPAGLENMTTDQLYAHYANKSGSQAKESFIDKITQKIRASFAGVMLSAVEAPNNNNTNPDNKMDFKNSLDLLNKGTLTAEDCTAIKAEITAFTGAAEKFTAAEVTAKVNQAVAEANTTAQAAADALTAQITELKATIAAKPAVENTDTIDTTKPEKFKGQKEWNDPNSSWNKNAEKL